MSEYLSKEEVRQWRSSLEKITLEEFAARLGKVIQSDKRTNDMVDIVMTKSQHSDDTEYIPHTEKITVIKEETNTPNIAKNSNISKKEVPVEKSSKPEKEKNKASSDKNSSAKPEKDTVKVSKTKSNQSGASGKTSSKRETKKVEPVLEPESINVTFSKPLIAREKMIFDYMVQNKNVVVYAKDMAELLNVPRDYVYKYIKNLRNKINEDVFLNADNGGYVLKSD